VLWPLALAAAAAPALAQGPAAAPVTFTGQIAPLLATRCVGCHRTGGDAPFSLADYDEVRRRASLVAAAVRSRYMPPWKPEPGHGRFQGDRRLSDAEIALIERWVSAGTPRGEGAVPPVPDRSRWQHGEPDLIVALPEYTLPAAGADRFRNFVVPVPLAATRYVRGLQFRANNAAIHHANIRIDRTTASRAEDAADPAPGYEGLILKSADYPDGHFLGWTPGQAPPPGPDDLAWRLDAGTDLVVQLHMRATGREERIQPEIGLYFSATPPTRTPVIFRLGRQTLEIPPGASGYRSVDSYVLPVAVQLRAIQPHAHYRAVEVTARATLPDGLRVPLLRIVRWDFNWQDQYHYAEPVALPAGTRIDTEYVFDNSHRNARNPDRPPVRVSWGWRTTDEMADVWLQVMPANDADRQRLVADVRRKMLTEDAAGCEVLLAREPDHVALRNDAATIYMELGKPERAAGHFEAVATLEPQSAAAQFNVGVALEAAGRADAALARYQRAIALAPTYSAAHNNAGSLLLASGRPQDALRHYQLAIDGDPANAEAHANLGAVYIGLGTSRAAVLHLREAVRIQPDNPAFLSGLAWVLAAAADATDRAPADAIAAAERALAVRGDPDARTLDALAAAYAAAGRYEDAVRRAGEAHERARRAGNERLATDIAGRLAGYRRGEPFVLTAPSPP
jgi:tetratricopeptide (TPR) repeat protein